MTQPLTSSFTKSTTAIDSFLTVNTSEIYSDTDTDDDDDDSDSDSELEEISFTQQSLPPPVTYSIEEPTNESKIHTCIYTISIEY
jgi:hypothetical protein